MKYRKSFTSEYSVEYIRNYANGIFVSALMQLTAVVTSHSTCTLPTYMYSIVGCSHLVIYTFKVFSSLQHYYHWPVVHDVNNFNALTLTCIN